VREALASENLPEITLVARGYGAERPIADNDTVKGRTRNRRIEITLLDPEPAPEDAGEETAPGSVADATPAPEAASGPR
jgi:hypothetical protein